MMKRENTLYLLFVVSTLLFILQFNVNTLIKDNSEASIIDWVLLAFELTIAIVAFYSYVFYKTKKGELLFVKGESQKQLGRYIIIAPSPFS